MSASFKNLKFVWDYFVLGRRTNIPPWVEPPTLEAQLWFGDLLVADLHRMAPHQGTWFSEYELRITSNQGKLQDQLLAFIAFCKDFHRRMDEGKDHDFNVFDQFVPISNCGSWSARLPSGCLVPMEGRMLFADGWTSWQHPETEPSTEAAACEFWVKNAPGTDVR